MSEIKKIIKHKPKYKVGDCVTIKIPYLHAPNENIVYNDEKIDIGVIVLEKESMYFADPVANTYISMPLYDVVICGKNGKIHTLPEWQIKGKC
jgi:hypothetical protein